MQRSWRTDHDKLTFIICTTDADEKKLASEAVRRGVSDCPEKMIGDINLFLAEADEDDEGCIGEVEIMIAEAGARGKGLGRSAVLAFMEYLRRHLEGILAEYRAGLEGGKKEGKMKLLQLRVKIGGKNLPSIALFESVGFVKVGEGENYFGEVELVFEGWCGKERVGGLMRRFGVEGWRECVYG